MGTHTLKREHHGKGEGLDSYIIPTCSCGWKGRAEYATNDYQMTEVISQERNHLRNVYLRSHQDEE